MWSLNNRIDRQCEAARDTLERSTNRAQEVGDTAFSKLLADATPSVRAHVAACGQCRIFAEELSEVREMLRPDSGGPQPGPFFLARVMASIAKRETELEKRSQIWAAVPRLASRLTVLASLTLLVAGSWLYQPPSHQVTTAVVSAEQSSEGLVEGGTTTIQDDFVLTAAD